MMITYLTVLGWSFDRDKCSWEPSCWSATNRSYLQHIVYEFKERSNNFTSQTRAWRYRWKLFWNQRYKGYFSYMYLRHVYHWVSITKYTPPKLSQSWFEKLKGCIPLFGLSLRLYCCIHGNVWKHVITAQRVWELCTVCIGVLSCCVLSRIEEGGSYVQSKLSWVVVFRGAFLFLSAVPIRWNIVWCHIVWGIKF